MNNKIKKILCFLADDNRVDERFYKALGKDKCKTLLDYITTLQEENKKIRKMNKAKHKYSMNMEDKYITLKAIMKKAREYIAIRQRKDGFLILDKEQIEELADILQGSDKE